MTSRHIVTHAHWLRALVDPFTDPAEGTAVLKSDRRSKAKGVR